MITIVSGNFTSLCSYNFMQKRMTSDASNRHKPRFWSIWRLFCLNPPPPPPPPPKKKKRILSKIILPNFQPLRRCNFMQTSKKTTTTTMHRFVIKPRKLILVRFSPTIFHPAQDFSLKNH